MRRLLAAILIQLIVVGASAALADDQTVCFGNARDNDAIIAACTRLSESGKVRGAGLAVVHNQRGLGYENKGEHERAVADFTEAIRLNPKYSIAFNNRSWSYNNAGEYDLAIADASEALRLDPKYPTAYINRGVSYERKGEYDRAIADYGEAIRHNPRFSAAYNNRGVCYNNTGQYDRAIADFNEAIRLQPKATSSYYNRGVSFEKKGDLERALNNYRAVLSLNPRDQTAPIAIRQVEQKLADRNGPDLAAVAQTAQPAALSPGPATTAPNRVSSAPAVPVATFARRLALVVGNGDYRFANKLSNPGNDAADIAQALRKLRFDVIEGFNLDKRSMEDKLREFGRKLDGADLALFFYAGHGMQVGGRNYLVPVDGKLERPGDLTLDTIDLGQVLAQMEAQKRVNLVLLDACRDNPLARSFARSLGARSMSVGRGLAMIQSTIGTMIAYATQPDNIALDGKGRNSPFTTALLKHISTPGLEISSLMKRVRADVIQATQEKQVPWEYSSLLGDVVLAQ